jgi:DNA primase large subunit
MRVTDYAKYPFLDVATQYVRQNKMTGMPLQEMLQTTFGTLVMEHAKYRIRCALHGTRKVPPVTLPLTADHDLFSYHLARLLVSCAPYNQKIVAKFVAHETDRAYKAYVGAPDHLKLELQQQFGFPVASTRVSVTDYIPMSIGLKRDPKFKLVNMTVVGGQVTMPADSTSDIFKERIRQRIRRGLPIAVHPDITVLLTPIITDLFAQYQATMRTDYGTVTASHYPPCIAALLARVRNGESIAHPARFAMVTFLHEIGMPDSEIAELFAASQGFDLQKTMYQISHITGNTYKMQMCDTLKSFSLCCAGPDPLCAKIHHPLGYYQAKNLPDEKKLKTGKKKPAGRSKR